MTEDVLVLEEINKTYSGIRVLRDVDFSVRRGEVHCLVGENGSGKSTLIKIITGIVPPDPGARLTINGRKYFKLSPIDSMREGIQVIYQDLSLFPNLSVAENIAMNQMLEENRQLLNRRDMERIAREAIGKIGIQINLGTLVGELPIAKQQCVAICRAMTRGEKIIIMDEPTSSLGKKDIDYLFSIIRTVKDRGITVMFVGHKLNEIFEIADRVTVLRDGRKIGTFPIGELNKEQLIRHMTGKEIKPSRYERNYSESDVILEVRNLSKRGQFRNVTFSLHRGEILGLTGLVGSGRTELALSLFGMAPPDDGDILLEGRSVRVSSPQEAMRHGICYVPEDRLSQGLFMEHSISVNMIITVLRKLVNKLGLLNKKRISSVNDYWIRSLNIKTPSPHLQVKKLSGGNQQRVVISKWLEREPKILILDGPTIGVDIGAKEEIHAIIKELADKGMGIIVISDEAAEAVLYTHRILLMKEGSIQEQFEASEITESELLEKLSANEDAAPCRQPFGNVNGDAND